MKKRCSPYNHTVLLSGILVIFILLHAHPSLAQCKGEFTYQTYAAENDSSTGKIEISVINPESGSYTFKIYKMEEKMTLVETATRVVSASDRITFEGLAPSRYYVRIEWGASCHKVMGGLEGITITPKDQVR